MSGTTGRPAKGEAAPPRESAPPPGRKLVLWVLGALIGAAVLLVLVVLPAEYGIDPTGFGGAIGLTGLGGGESAAMADLPVAEGFHAGQSKTYLSETITVPVGAYEEVEVKYGLAEAATLLYSWTSDGAPLYVDMHGHPYNDLDGTEVRYEELLEASEQHGAVRAPYGGMHGWYWRNETDQPATVSLQVTCFFSHHEEMMRQTFEPEELEAIRAATPGES